MKQFFRKEFGTSNMFRFDITGKLIVRNSKYNDFLKTANNDQKKLLKGLHDAIESSTTYNVRISSDGTDKMKVRARIPNGKYDSNSSPLDKVQFQNAALRNENKPERDGQDH